MHGQTNIKNNEIFERIFKKTVRLNEIIWQHKSRIMHGLKILSVL